MSIAALLLAAGRARRFGAAEDDSKVVADFGGLPLVTRIAMTGLASRATPVVIVTGHAAVAVEAALAGLTVQIIHNRDYSTGMASSLKAGLAALPPEAGGALILLADMPLVSQATLDRLIAWFETNSSEVEAVVPTFEGRRGNPVLIGRTMFSAVASLHGDEGARKLLAASGRAVAFCAVDDRGIEIDVDTPEALEALAKMA